MVMPLDENRDLMLSMFIDGELDSSEVQMVEDKVKNDAGWRAEYNALVVSEKRVSKVVENNWHDSDFTSGVMVEVRKLPKPDQDTALKVEQNASRSQRLKQTHDSYQITKDARTKWLGWTAAAAALLLFGFSVKLLTGLFPDDNQANHSVAQLLGRFQSGSFKIIKKRSGKQKQRSAKESKTRALAGDTILALNDTALIKWEDESQLWLKKGSKVKALKMREIALTSGSLFIDVAQGENSFTIKLPDGSIAEALGTQFEVRANSEKSVVRVVEGHVRYTRDKKALDVRGGQEVTANLNIRPFDPREVSLTWQSKANKSSIEGAPLWSQLGGNPSHSGLTPATGPKGQPQAAVFYPFSADILSHNESSESTLYKSSVISADQKVFVVRKTGKNSTQLLALDLKAASPSWKACGEPLIAHPYCAPIITPTGLVVFATSAGKVRAWDPAKGKMGWANDADVGHSILALAVSHKGTILCSTFEHLIALNGDGQQIWTFGLQGDIKAPASVMPNGNIAFMTRFGQGAVLNPSGQKLRSITWEGQDIQWPLVVQKDNTILTTSLEGGLKSYSEKSKPVTLSSDRVHTWPLGSGFYAASNFLLFAGESEIRKTLPVPGHVSALGQDQSGAIFAAIRNTVFRVPNPIKNKDAQPLHCLVKRGQVVQGGIAILPGKLIVTTTDGVQVIE